MLELKVTIQTVNAAFDECPREECARILRELAARLERGDSYTFPRLRDSNGNVCCEVEVIE